MARNQEVIRQWQMLRAIAAARLGITVDALAAEQDVTTRTIRRDLAALERAGFPLYSDKDDGPTRWKIDPKLLKGLEQGFTLIELCALYFSRVTLDCLAGAPFHDDLQRAFGRFEQALTPNMRTFLDRIPRVMGAKRGGGRKADRQHRERVAQLLEASLDRRKVRMRYHSLSSQRTKDYDVDPHRVVYAEGSLYLIAYVPEYKERRTFAIARIERLQIRDEHFPEPRDLGADVFPHSLGVHSGPPERIEVEFSARVAAHVAEREWHPTQKVRPRPDGTVRMELQVSNDWALRRWILGFGAAARVIAPSSLAESILDELDDARAQYVPRLDLEMPRFAYDLASQNMLPFASAAFRGNER